MFIFAFFEYLKQTEWMRCTLENGEARSYGFGGCPLRTGMQRGSRRCAAGRSEVLQRWNSLVDQTGQLLMVTVHSYQYFQKIIVLSEYYIHQTSSSARLLIWNERSSSGTSESIMVLFILLVALRKWVYDDVNAKYIEKFNFLVQWCSFFYNFINVFKSTSAINFGSQHALEIYQNVILIYILPYGAKSALSIALLKYRRSKFQSKDARPFLPHLNQGYWL